MGATLQSDQCSHVSLSPEGNNPILSSSVAAVFLALLYLPRFLVRFVLSPVTLSAVALLTALLRYGANSPLTSYTAQLSSSQRAPQEEVINISYPESCIKLSDQFPQNTNQPDHHEGGHKKEVFDSQLPPSAGESEGDHSERGVEDLSEIRTKIDLGEARTQVGGVGHMQTTPFRQDFFDRCRGDPLEVIYEEYGEGEDGAFEVDFQIDPTDKSNQPTNSEPIGDAGWRSETEYARSGFCFTSSDDSSSDSGGGSPLVDWWEFPDNQCFQWEVGDSDEEGMIEIPLEEDNLIELDLSVFR